MFPWLLICILCLHNSNNNTWFSFLYMLQLYSSAFDCCCSLHQCDAISRWRWRLTGTLTAYCAITIPIITPTQLCIHPRHHLYTLYNNLIHCGLHTLVFLLLYWLTSAVMLEWLNDSGLSWLWTTIHASLKSSLDERWTTSTTSKRWCHIPYQQSRPIVALPSGLADK